jgi:hypothetical protein
MSQLRRAGGCFADLLHVLPGVRVELGVLQHDFGGAENRGEQIVEVMRDAPREVNHRLDALGSPHMRLMRPLRAAPDGVGCQHAKFAEMSLLRVGPAARAPVGDYQQPGRAVRCAIPNRCRDPGRDTSGLGLARGILTRAERAQHGLETSARGGLEAVACRQSNRNAFPHAEAGERCVEEARGESGESVERLVARLVVGRSHGHGSAQIYTDRCWRRLRHPSTL